MATKQTINGKRVFEPGVYTSMKSGIKNDPAITTYGNLLIIDKGLGAGFGCGSGVLGSLKSGKAAIEEFDTLDHFRDRVKGGKLWLLGKPLFRPSKDNTVQGVSKIFLVRAAQTTEATLTLSFNAPATEGGTLVLGVKDEGLIGNGVLVNGVLTKGYAAKLKRSERNADKFILEFYLGTFKGNDEAGEAFDFIPEASVKPLKVCSSAEFSDLTTLRSWMQKDVTFNEVFSLESLTITGAGLVVEADLTAYASLQLFAGGTETYSAEALDAVLDNIPELDYSFILAGDSGEQAQSADNTKILSHLTDEAVHEKCMIVAGGSDALELTSSIETAQYYNSPKVIVVHGGCGKKAAGTAGFKMYDALYKAALVAGRICGLPPQVPVTYKDLDQDIDAHNMNPKERERALDAGVLHVKSENGAFFINEGVNTLQANSDVVNPDAQSHLVSVTRIFADLNKGLVINAKEQLLKQKNGVNRNTLSDLDLKLWAEGYLENKVATDSQDNLITYFDNVQVTSLGNTKKVNYRVEPNFEVSRLFVQGTIIDRNSL